MCLLDSWEMLEKAFQDFRILPGAKEMCVKWEWWISLWQTNSELSREIKDPTTQKGGGGRLVWHLLGWVW